MKKYLFDKEGNWYKANLHSHSTISDGRMTPEEAKQRYKSEGYQIYAYSDHHVLVPHPELRDDDFLPITAMEASLKDYSNPENKEPQTYHLNFFSKDETRNEFVYFPRKELEEKGEYSAQIINDLIARANSEGFLAQYNHPHWSTQTIRDFGALEGLWGFEVFNGSCQVSMCTGWGDQQFVQMMWEGKYLCPTGGDDNHSLLPGTDPFCVVGKAFTMIRAPKLEYSAVLQAMENKQLYASTGPLIKELYVEDGKVYIKTSPVNNIVLRTQYRGKIKTASISDDITEAVFDISKLDTPPRYIRFEVWDSHNNRAITRAFFPEEWE